MKILQDCVLTVYLVNENGVPKCIKGAIMKVNATIRRDVWTIQQRFNEAGLNNIRGGIKILWIKTILKTI